MPLLPFGVYGGTPPCELPLVMPEELGLMPSAELLLGGGQQVAGRSSMLSLAGLNGRSRSFDISDAIRKAAAVVIQSLAD